MFVSRGNALSIYVFFSLLPYSHIMFVMPYEHKILMDPRTWAFDKVSFLPPYKVNGVLTAPRGHAFYLSQNLLQKYKEPWCSKKHEWSRKFIKLITLFGSSSLSTKGDSASRMCTY